MQATAAPKQQRRHRTGEGGRTLAVTTAMDRALEGAVTTGSVPGVVALAADDSGIIYQGAYGTREAGADRPMTLDTVFWIASMTKAVTTTAAMQMVEQGKLGLDEPIGRVLPELAAPLVLDGFDDAGAPRFRPARPADHAAPPPHPHRPASATTPGMLICFVMPNTSSSPASPKTPPPVRVRRWCSIPATAGSTASTSTGPARRSRQSAARGSPITCATISSSRSA